MAKDKAVSKKNKNSSLEKSKNETANRKTGSFIPKKAEVRQKAKEGAEFGARPRIESEKAKGRKTGVKTPEIISVTESGKKPSEAKSDKEAEKTGKKLEKRSETEHGKRGKKEKPISSRIPLSKFLPMSPEEVKARGWRELDIILVTGDADTETIPVSARQ